MQSLLSGIGGKKQQSKLIASGARSLYDVELLSKADQVDCIPKKATAMEKASRGLLNKRDLKFTKVAEAFAAYGDEMTQAAPAAYMASVGKVFENLAGRYRDTDAKLSVDFSNKLASWVAQRQHLMDMQIKLMEDQRKELQKCEKGGKKNADKFGGATDAAKAAWEKSCVDTTAQMDKFIADASEIARSMSGWVKMETNMDKGNCAQCKTAVSGSVDVPSRARGSQGEPSGASQADGE